MSTSASSIFPTAESEELALWTATEEKREKRVTFGSVTIITITPRETSTFDSLGESMVMSAIDSQQQQWPSSLPSSSAIASCPAEANNSLPLDMELGEPQPATGPHHDDRDPRVDRPTERLTEPDDTHEASLLVIQPSPKGRHNDSIPEMMETPSELFPIHPPYVASPPNNPAPTKAEPAPLPTLTGNTVDSRGELPRCVFCGVADDAVVQSSGVDLHVNCALWSPEVYGDPLTQELQNVHLALERSRNIKCAYCRKPFASVGCVEENCQRSYHYPCAVKVGAQLQVPRFEMSCPVHKREASTAKRRRR